MKWMLFVVAGLVALVAMVALVGWMLPQHHEASRSAVLAAGPQVVWGAITDVTAYPQWRSDVRSVDRLPDRDGRPVWREHGRHGAITYEAVRLEPPTRFETRIADTGLAFGGTWTYALAPEGDGTRLTITERGEIYNPVFRALAHFVFGYTSTMEAYLAAVDRRLAAAPPRTDR
jgi:uncharacterized protein YndB with AHSA1/START domain